jgi:glycosyltransferase involved in cell wall biosynthesis
MEQNILISVIVPIYNVEKYLNQAIDSILAQTYKNLEILLIDDGSTDNCGKICDEYASKDNRIKVIHKENGGLGKAYNTGLELATGNYIAFVESDDYIEPNMYEVMLENAIKYNTDTIKCDFYWYNRKADIQNLPYCGTKIFNQKEPTGSFIIDDFPILCAYHSSIWSYLHKAEFVKQIKFVETVGAGYVDAPFTFEVLCKAKSIVLLSQPLYHYRMENHGNSVSLSDERSIQMAYRFCEAKNVIKKYNKYDLLKEVFYLHASVANYIYYKRIEPQYRYEYFLKLRELFSDLKDDKNFEWKYIKKYKKWILAINNNNFEKSVRCVTRRLHKIFSIKDFYKDSKKYKLIFIMWLMIKIPVKQ